MPVAAHTTAVASWPAVGEVVTSAPGRVTVAYSTEVLPDVTVSVVGPDGTSLADGEPVVVGRLVTQALVESEAAGAYSASFEVVGDDLHVVAGSYEFVVDPDGVETGNPAGPPPDLGLEERRDGRRLRGRRGTRRGLRGSTLLLTGLAGAVLLVVVIRLAGRRRRGLTSSPTAENAAAAPYSL